MADDLDALAEARIDKIRRALVGMDGVAAFSVKPFDYSARIGVAITLVSGTRFAIRVENCATAAEDAMRGIGDWREKMAV